jgi:Glycosyltransferase like family
MRGQRVTFVVAVNDDGVFEGNFLASPCVQGRHPHEVLVQRGFPSASAAYNDAMDRSGNDLLVFCHQDIFLPSFWIGNLTRSLEFLEKTDPQWGVLGSYGTTVEGDAWGQVYSRGLGLIGRRPEEPRPVQTLDEIVLILRKSSGLRFDDSLPHYHFYGVDICMRAAKAGRRSYAIPGFAVHNTQLNLALPKEFYRCYRHVKATWKDSLPIQTSCIRVTKWDGPLYERKLRETYLKCRRSGTVGADRSPNLFALLQEIAATCPQLSDLGQEQP